MKKIKAWRFVLTLFEAAILVMVGYFLILGWTLPHTEITHARETTLRQDLDTFRKVIDQYTLDKERAPQSLNDLVTAGYMREIPVDPFTRSKETWVVVQEDLYNSFDQTEPGITDVHSGAIDSSLDGTPYSSW